MDSVVLIPERDLRCCSTWRGHKPPSLASEVSIPERDLEKERSLFSSPSFFNDTG
jgi:hypothetical protein